MRIDKFLKVSRIIKRRTIANEVCVAGRVLVNNKPVKASYNVKVDDVIELKLSNRILKFKVLSVNQHIKKEDVSNTYVLPLN